MPNIVPTNTYQILAILFLGIWFWFITLLRLFLLLRVLRGDLNGNRVVAAHSERRREGEDVSASLAIFALADNSRDAYTTNYANFRVKRMVRGADGELHERWVTVRRKVTTIGPENYATGPYWEND